MWDKASQGQLRTKHQAVDVTGTMIRLESPLPAHKPSGQDNP